MLSRAHRSLPYVALGGLILAILACGGILRAEEIVPLADPALFAPTPPVVSPVVSPGAAPASSPGVAPLSAIAENAAETEKLSDDGVEALACLNCEPPSADLLVGATTTLAPGGGWILRPFAQVTGETPITLGKGSGARTYVRAWSDVTIGTRTSEDEPVSTDDAGLTDVSSWASAEVIGGLSTVVGQSADGNVLTSIYAAAGGKIALDTDADAEPRVAKVFEAGARVQVLSASADVRLGLGRDEEGLPEVATLGVDGTPARTLQAIISARLPIKGTGKAAWLWLRASNPIMGEGRPVVSIGLAGAPGAILARILGR